MNDSHRRPGWKHTVARRAIGAILAANAGKPLECKTCGDLGFIIDSTKRPASVPCPDCQKEAAFEYDERKMFPFATSRHTMTD